MLDDLHLSPAAYQAYSAALTELLTGYTGKKRKDSSLTLLISNALADVPIEAKSKIFLDIVKSRLGFRPELPVSAADAEVIREDALHNPEAYQMGQKTFLSVFPTADGGTVFAEQPTIFVARIAQALLGYGTHLGAYDTGFGSAPIAMSLRTTSGLKFSGNAQLNRFLVCATTPLGEHPSLIEALMSPNPEVSIEAFLSGLRAFFPEADTGCLQPLKDRLEHLRTVPDTRPFSNADAKDRPWKVPSIFLPDPYDETDSVETFLFTSHAAREANAMAHEILKEESERGAKSFKPKASVLDAAVEAHFRERGHDIQDVKAKEKAEVRREISAKMEADAAYANYSRSREAMRKHLRRNAEPEDSQTHRTHAFYSFGFGEISGNAQNLYSGAQGGVRMIKTTPWVQRENQIAAFLAYGDIMAIRDEDIERHLNAARIALKSDSGRRADSALEKVFPIVMRHYMRADARRDTRDKVRNAMSKTVLINTLNESGFLRDTDDLRLRSGLDRAAEAFMKEMRR